MVRSRGCTAVNDPYDFVSATSDRSPLPVSTISPR